MNWNYPLHLGVTEAGEGEDARIKSSIGIGSLLAMELATPSAFRSLKIVLTKFPWRERSSRIFATHPTPHIEHRTSTCHLIHSPISGGRRRRSSAME